MLDVISGGRLEFGIGRGYQPRETEVLGGQMGATIQDQERNRAYFEEALRDHPEVLDAGLVQPPRRVLHDPAHLHPLEPPPDDRLLPGTGRRAQPRGRPGSRRARHVLDGQPGARHHHQAAGAAGLPAAGAEAAPPDVGAGHQPPLGALRRRAGHERLLHRRAEPAAQGTWSACTCDEAEQAGWPDRLDRGQFKYGWDAEKRRGVDHRPLRAPRRQGHRRHGPGRRGARGAVGLLRALRLRRRPGRATSEELDHGPQGHRRGAAPQGRRPARLGRLRDRGDHEDQGDLRLRGLHVQRLVRAGRVQRQRRSRSRWPPSPRRSMPVLRAGVRWVARARSRATIELVPEVRLRAGV